MSCERARELMIDALVEPIDTEHREELRRHLAECEACASVAAEYEQLWQRLETVAIPLPSPGGLERLRKKVREEFGHESVATVAGLVPPTVSWGRLVSRAAAMVALVGLGAILAIGLEGLWSDAQRGDSAIDNRSRYLLIMTDTQEGPELAEQAQSEMQAWVGELIEQGIVESVVGLTDDSLVGTPPGGTLLNGPVTGFIIIRAASHQEARRITVGSPSIKYGGFIEIRAINDGGSDP